MNRTTKGLITGAILGSAIAFFAGSDHKGRKKMIRGSRHAMRKAENIIDDVKDLF